MRGGGLYSGVGAAVSNTSKGQPTAGMLLLCRHGEFPRSIRAAGRADAGRLPRLLDALFYISLNHAAAARQRVCWAIMFRSPCIFLAQRRLAGP